MSKLAKKLSTHSFSFGFMIFAILLIQYHHQVSWVMKELLVSVPGILYHLRNPATLETININWNLNLKNPYKPRSGAPNIILIVADDLGINDLSGGAGVLTPNIDSIAKNGIKFTNAYAAQATCAPSRAALFTGRNPTEIGFEFTPVPLRFSKIMALLETNPAHPPIYHKESATQIPHFNSMAIPNNVSTIAEELKVLGYNNYLMGKWHLGSTPKERGFDETITFPAGFSQYLDRNDPNLIEGGLEGTYEMFDKTFRYNMPFSVSHNNGPAFAPNEYMTDYLSTQAAQFIKQYTQSPKSQEFPFFLSLTYTAPHTPLQALKSDFESEEVAHIDSRTGRIYASMIKALDRGVGKVLESLKETNQLENTVIVFTSDNGGAHYLGLQHLNVPYRGWKGTFFEGGIRVPLFMQWKNHLPKSMVSEEVVTHKDLFQTFKQMGRGNTIKYFLQPSSTTSPILPQDTKEEESGYSLNGSRDMIRLLNLQGTTNNSSNNQQQHKVFYWRGGHNKAIRYQHWKLTLSSNPDKFWFFDLHADPYEQVNLASHALSSAKISTSVLLQTYEDWQQPNNCTTMSQTPSESSFPSSCTLLKSTLMVMVEKLLEVDDYQVNSLWPSILETAVTIDKTAMDEVHPHDDEFIYVVN